MAAAVVPLQEQFHREMLDWISQFSTELKYSVAAESAVSHPPVRGRSFASEHSADAVACPPVDVVFTALQYVRFFVV